MTEDNSSPVTTVNGGYHNIDEFGYYKSLSKRELFIILREVMMRAAQPVESWTEQADKELKQLTKYGIK